MTNYEKQKRRKILAETLKVDVKALKIDAENYPDEFELGDKLYEVITIASALENAIDNNHQEYITKGQIDYWTVTTNINYYWREF